MFCISNNKRIFPLLLTQILFRQHRGTHQKITFSRNISDIISGIIRIDLSVEEACSSGLSPLEGRV